MRLTALILAAAAALAPQSDEEKATEVFKSFLKAIRESDHEKLGDLLHPKSAIKVRDRFLSLMEKSPDAARARILKTIGYKDSEEMKAATPRALFVSIIKNYKDLGEGPRQVLGAMESAETTVIGAVKKDDKVYIIAESTITLAGETHLMPFLQVAYRDGDAWKLAYRGETNIGK